MAGNLGELIQMITGLSQIQDRKRQLDLSAEQLHQQASQFASQDQEGKFTQALKIIAGSSAKSREGLGTLINSLAPQYREAAQAYLSGQPIDPTVIHAASITAGDAAMDPRLRGQVNQESAVQNSTGMNQGQVAGSQFMSQLASGATPTPAMSQDFAQHAANGQTPFQASIDQTAAAQGLAPRAAGFQYGGVMTPYQNAVIGVQQGQNNLGWAGLDLNERKMAAEYGLDKLLKTAQANAANARGGLTGQEWLTGVKTIGDLMNDINNPKSDKAANDVRIKLANILKNTLGLPMGQDLPVSSQGSGTPGQTPVFRSFINGFLGNGMPTGQPSGPMPWPTMEGTTPAGAVNPPQLTTPMPIGPGGNWQTQWQRDRAAAMGAQP